MYYRFLGSLIALTYSFSLTLHAAPAVFTIDPAQSLVTISGSIAGTTVKEQGPGSLTTKFGGTLKAEITGTTIQFTGGSVVDAEVNGTWEPAVGGGAGSAPADFGGQAGSFLGTAKGAFRNIVLDVTSNPLTLANGAFDASALVFGFPAGSTAALDYNIILAKGSEALTGLSTNRVSEAGTLATEGGVQKLVIRVDTEYKFSALIDNDSTARFVGQLVATSSEASQPVISGFNALDKKLSLTVQGATTSAQLQSTTDFTTWQPRTAERKTEGDQTTFTVEQSGGVEFFRVAQ